MAISKEQQKRINKIVEKFQRETQKTVNSSEGIDGISLQFGDNKPIVIAKKEDSDNG